LKTTDNLNYALMLMQLQADLHCDLALQSDEKHPKIKQQIDTVKQGLEPLAETCELIFYSALEKGVSVPDLRSWDLQEIRKGEAVDHCA